MKSLKRVLSLFVVLALSMGIGVYAQNPSAVSIAMSELEKKYEDTEGVDCVTLTKGNGLDMMKMMLNKELGRSFMKGVTSITLIDYSEASAQVRKSLGEELETITSMLEEFDTGENKGAARGFASTADIDAGKLSDFLIVIENDDSKTVMYMAGEIVLK